MVARKPPAERTAVPYGSQPPARPSGARWAPGSDELGKLPQQGGLGLSADDLLDDLTVLENAHRRDVHDVIALRDGRILVDVELDNIELVSMLGRDLFQHRSYHAARPAPLRPVVNDHRLVGLQNLDLEGGLGYGLGCAHFRTSFPLFGLRRPFCPAVVVADLAIGS